MFSIPSLSISTTEKQNERSNELESILLNLPRIEEGAKDCLRNLAKFKAEPAEIELVHSFHFKSPFIWVLLSLAD